LCSDGLASTFCFPVTEMRLGNISCFLLSWYSRRPKVLDYAAHGIVDSTGSPVMRSLSSVARLSAPLTARGMILVSKIPFGKSLWCPSSSLPRCPRHCHQPYGECFCCTALGPNGNGSVGHFLCCFSLRLCPYLLAFREKLDFGAHEGRGRIHPQPHPCS